MTASIAITHSIPTDDWEIEAGEATRDSSADDSAHSQAQKLIETGPADSTTVLGAGAMEEPDVDRSTSSLDPHGKEREGFLPDRIRLVGELLADNPETVLTVLSFINTEGRVRADRLLSMGTGDVPELFAVFFSLYDLGLIERDEASVRVSEIGSAILHKLGIT